MPSRTRATDALLIIRDVAQLRALRATPSLLSSRALVLELPGLSADEARAVGERLASYAHECGCSVGAKCMVATIGIALAWLALRYGILSASFLWRLSWLPLWALAGASVGKSAAIVQARSRFKKAIDRLIAVRA